MKSVLKFVVAALVSLCLCGAGYCQVPDQREQIRLSIWAELDAYPGLFGDEPHYVEPEQSEAGIVFEKNKAEGADEGRDSGKSKYEVDISMYDFAISRAKEVSPFLINGMINGWTFEYVPYDKTRQVAEFFDFGNVREFDSSVNPIAYKYPTVDNDNNRILCWAYCDRTSSQQLHYERWMSIQHPRVTGHGTGDVSKGFEGIKDACSAAVRNAVREYWRTLVKNKPKEISGKVLLIQEPRIYIKDGQYVVDLDFFLETDRIILYSLY